jgi:hypothetical protein
MEVLIMNASTYINRAATPFFISIGTAVPGDTITDPQTLMNETTGLTMGGASVNYAPKVPFHGFIVKGGAAGQTDVNVKVKYLNGSYFTWNISSIAANDQWVVEGEMLEIVKTITTADLVFPIF